MINSMPAHRMQGWWLVEDQLAVLSWLMQAGERAVIFVYLGHLGYVRTERAAKVLKKFLIGRASAFGFAFVNQCLSEAHGASHILGELRLPVGPHQEHGVVVARQQNRYAKGERKGRCCVPNRLRRERKG